ncbi:MAG: phosphopantothenoylcysteine decarboxylase [Candidatus Omnitrophota bacterium]
MNLKNKRILITAGPTWVPIDDVRVISNVATGATGALCAKKLSARGAKVTLLLGPCGKHSLSNSIRLINFRFFNELRDILKRELKNNKYDVVIHSAAVSDYRPSVKYAQKVNSGRKTWTVNLMPTPKIIDLIRKIDRTLFLVGFKFEPGARKKILIDKTKTLINRARLDLAIANTVYKNKYRAYIINQNKAFGPLMNKDALAERLINLIGESL